MLRVGLVGCGTIGEALALSLHRKHHRTARVVALHDKRPDRARRIQHRITPPPRICSIPALIRSSHLVIEAASQEAARQVVPAALRAHRSVLVMSVGGLLRDRSWQRIAHRSRGRVYVPSGALVGLDGVKAMAVGRIRRMALTTRKPPRAFAEAPYVKRKGLRLVGRRRPLVLFEGSATSAVRAFPQNTNVAATLALASGVPPSRVRVRVIADPTIRTNVHELEVIGDRSRLACRIESAPSASNVKTSEQAVRSALATLEGLLDSVVVGT